jgi:lipopolysaccharide transport system permease protein
MNRRFVENIRLAGDLARRDLEAKHKRSLLGWLWLVITPLCLLGIYSLVFGLGFGVTWHEILADGEHKVGFGLPFFVGLVIYLLFSDVVNSSTVLFVSKRTFVVKSPFPIWVLWLANLIRAAVSGGVAFVLVLFMALVEQRLTWVGTGWMLLAMVNIVVFITALSLLLSALGPFIGDISEAIRLLLRVLFYATPITYPLSMIPSEWRDWMWLNPLTCMIEPLRSAIVFGTAHDYWYMMIFWIVSLLLFAFSFWVFNRVKGVVSDVV